MATVIYSVAALVLWRLRHNTARTDILAADDAQRVDPLFIRGNDALRALAHLAPENLKRDSCLDLNHTPELPAYVGGTRGICCKAAAKPAHSGGLSQGRRGRGSGGLCLAR